MSVLMQMVAQQVFQFLRKENMKTVFRYANIILWVVSLTHIACSQILYIALSFTIAFCVSDLGIVLRLMGASGSLMVAYILPGNIMRSFL
jgi:hypothetical protein